MRDLHFRLLGKRFGADRRGNVAMLTTLAIVPLTIASMGAVDITRGVAAHVELQDALDAAALAAGRSGATDNASLQATGDRVLKQNVSDSADFTVTDTSFKIGDSGQVVASASATYQSTFAALSGGQGHISASTEVTRANSILEIALVLDNTGSMNDSLGRGGSKISLLRTAASNFVDTMSSAAKASSVANSISISLVPFSNTVRVGEKYKTETWIDQTGASPINNEIFTTSKGVTQKANRFDLFKALGTTWGGCVESRQAPYDIQDTAPTTSTPATLFTPFFAPDEADNVVDRRGQKQDNDYVKDPIKENGVTLDWWGQQGSIAKYSTRPTETLNTYSGPNTTIGPNAGCGMQAVQRLTTDFSALKSAIGQMVAVGDTNIPMGLVWGWHTLSPNAPFADGVPYGTAKHKKIVVLMTDGQNTMTNNSNINDKSYYSGVGYVWQGRVLQPDNKTPLTDTRSSSDERTAAMDDRLKRLCTNMKAPGVDIEIYAIGVGVTTSSRALLKSCATDSDHYFDVTSGTALDGTFQSVANQIAQLHLSK
jgi:Flp pilus assembly protein TadG